MKKFAGNRYDPKSQRVQTNRTVNLVLSISSHARSRAVMRSQEGRSGYCDGKPKRQRGAWRGQSTPFQRERRGGGSRACRTLRDAMGWSDDEDGGLGRSEPRDRAREEIPPETGTFPNRNVYKPESDRERDLFLHDSISGIAASSRR